MESRSPRPTEREGFTYPSPFDQKAYEALMEVRGPRANKVKLQLTKPCMAFIDDWGDLHVQEVPAGVYTFDGSNELAGEWFADEGERAKHMSEETKNFLRGKKFIQLTREGHIWLSREDWDKHVLVVDGLYDAPGQFDALFASMKAREKEFREATKRWILNRDAGYKRNAQTEFAKKNKPIRHPKGKEYDQATYEYFWEDGLFCGTDGTDPLEEFFEISLLEIGEIGGEVETWGATIFNECFREVMPPEMHHVLEG